MSDPNTMAPTVSDNDLAEFARLGVATVYEAAGREGMVDEEWIHVTPGKRAAGRAYTALCADGDNRAVHEAVAKLAPGDILVVSSPHPTPFGLIGELLATQALVHGASALIVNGGVRDTDDLRELGLPVWSRFVRVRGAAKDQRGHVDVPVTIGGQDITPGDVIVADADGVVIVPLHRAAGVLAASLARETKERGLRQRWASGELSYDAYGFRQIDEA